MSRSSQSKSPVVGVVMGSESDWAVMQHAVQIFEDFRVPYEARVVSAHRTPDAMFSYATSAGSRGLKLIIAGAGGAAHLPGMIASKTTLPVLGVPVTSRALRGLDSLLSIAQMPKGIPVATFAVGEAGAANAALFAIAVLAGDSPALARKLSAFRSRQRARVRAMKLPTVKKKTAEKKAVTKKTATKTAVAKKTIVKKAATKKVASRK
jgi:5-(carboxyamino)imidazole ribonucleotide mutase